MCGGRGGVWSCLPFENRHVNHPLGQHCAACVLLLRRHMPVVRRLATASAPPHQLPLPGALATAVPGERVQLLYVYDFVKVTQLLLGVKPSGALPFAPGQQRAAGGDGSASVATEEDDDEVEETQQQRCGSTAGAASRGQAASTGTARATLRLSPIAFSRLARMAAALASARAAVAADNFAAALSALRRPLLRLPRALDAARAAATEGLKSGGAEAVRSRARLAVSLSLGAEATALAGVLTVACGGGPGADAGAVSDAVSLLREAEALMIEFASAALLPRDWLDGSAAEVWMEAGALAVGDAGASLTLACLPLSGTVTLVEVRNDTTGAEQAEAGAASEAAAGSDAAAAEPPVAVAAAPLDAVARVRCSLCQQLLASEAFEDCASVISSLDPARLAAELRCEYRGGPDAGARVAVRPARRFGDAELREMQASLTASLTTAMLDRSDLARTALGDTAPLGAFMALPLSGAAGSFPALVRDAVASGWPEAGDGPLRGSWETAPSSAASLTELRDAESMLTGAIRLCNTLDGLSKGGCDESVSRALRGRPESLSALGLEPSAPPSEAPPPPCPPSSSGGAGPAQRLLRLGILPALHAARAAAALAQAAAALPSAEAGRHCARAAADLGAAAALGASRPEPLLLAAVAAAVPGLRDAVSLPGLRAGAAAVGAERVAAAALGPMWLLLPAADGDGKAACSALAAAACGAASAAARGEWWAIRARVASAIVGVCAGSPPATDAASAPVLAEQNGRHRGAGVGMLRESTENGARTTEIGSTKPPHSDSDHGASAVQLSEMDAILAAMQSAGAV